jgi:hypothetical protein
LHPPLFKLLLDRPFAKSKHDENDKIDNGYKQQKRAGTTVSRFGKDVPPHYHVKDKDY